MWEVITILILVGAALVFAEVFLPGGILGLFGAVALIAAIGVSFYANGPMVGSLTAAGVGFGAIIGFLFWLKFFPSSAVGRRLTLSVEQPPHAGGLTHEELIGKEGVAVSALRPSGVALIDGKRIDVSTGGSFLERDCPIIVDYVEGSRIVVRKKL